MSVVSHNQPTTTQHVETELQAAQLPRPEPEPTRPVVHIEGPPRPARIELDLAQLRRNLRIIRASVPPGVWWLSVVKANAYGHGMVTMARETLAGGARCLGVATLGEGLDLRRAGISAPILLMGERHPDELPCCLEHRFDVCIGDLDLARRLDQLALQAAQIAPVHLKVNTGLNRFGVPWESAAAAAAALSRLPGLRLDGVMSHFAMSDEPDKTFALEQLRRFQVALQALADLRIPVSIRHLCNTGGFLDLPVAHFDMVRLGILPTGVYPSASCRRLPGLAPVMTLKARFTAVRELAPGDTYGYGLRYRAPAHQRIGVLPLGYGDGYPRLRNQGAVLVHGQRAPIVGGVAMDAIGVNLTDLPQARRWDEAVLLGRQGEGEIPARELAEWGGTVCYDLLAGWRSRLPRVLLGGETVSSTPVPAVGQPGANR